MSLKTTHIDKYVCTYLYPKFISTFFCNRIYILLSKLSVLQLAVKVEKNVTIYRKYLSAFK